MASPLQNAQNAFLCLTKEKPQIIIEAPGRVNLIGEHTDYNDGFVLPCAIDFHTIVLGSKRNDRYVRIIAGDYANAQDEFSLDEIIDVHPTKPWANYVRGMIALLIKSGCKLSGADIAISGNVPQGAGLSSSASLEVALGHFLNCINSLKLDLYSIALLGQRMENEFLGCNSGIMDQLIVSLGKTQHALLIDCRNRHSEAVAIPAHIALLVVDSRVQRGLVNSKYNERRQECEAAARGFGVNALRDLDLAKLKNKHARVSPLILRRAHHIISDSQRATELARLLPAGDLMRIGELMAASHRSMRDDFAITCPEVDALVDIVQTQIGKAGGVRMTGGGFGGCVVALLPFDAVDGVCHAIQRDYPARSGLIAQTYLCNASAGVRQIEP